MHRTAKVLFCDNEHGIGDVTFPDVDGLSSAELKQHFIRSVSLADLRKEAKEAGWTRAQGVDYCPGCSGSDAVNDSPVCPDCGRPNQFGELCEKCRNDPPLFAMS